MKSLDLIKKTQEKKREKKNQKENPSISKKNQPKAITSLNREKQTNKKTMLWVLVSVSMVIVIVGWLFFLPKSLSQNKSKGGGFQELTKEFGNFFETIDKTFKDSIEKFQENFPSLPDLENMSEEELYQYLEQLKIKELEKKVFPQFENINSNVNKAR